MDCIARRYVQRDKAAVIVDFGCGDMPYRPLFEARGASYCGIDLPHNPRADLHAGPSDTAPIADASADMVLSTQVLEHVVDPNRYLKECRRMLRPGGLIVLSTHGYWMYHPVPLDLWRWTGPGLRTVIESAGYEVLETTGLLGLSSAGLQLFQDGIIRHLPLFARPFISIFLQPLIALFDMLSSEAARQHDACVFVVVARAPGS